MRGGNDNDCGQTADLKHWPKALKQWETIAKDGGGRSERKNIEATVGELYEQRFSIQ